MERDAMLVQLSKAVPDRAEREEVLTTNLVKERVIQDMDRYSIVAEQFAEHGYDFVFTIAGPQYLLLLLLFIRHNAQGSTVTQKALTYDSRLVNLNRIMSWVAR